MCSSVNVSPDQLALEDEPAVGPYAEAAPQASATNVPTMAFFILMLLVIESRNADRGNSPRPPWTPYRRGHEIGAAIRPDVERSQRHGTRRPLEGGGRDHRVTSCGASLNSL